MSGQKLEVKATLGLTQAIAYLEDLARTLRNGTVVIQNNGDFVTLNPAENLGLEIEARRKDNKQSLGLKFAWRTDAPVVETAALTISSVEPEPPVVDVAADVVASGEPASAEGPAEDDTAKPDKGKRKR